MMRPAAALLIGHCAI